MPQIGDQVEYRSIAGDLWSAEVTRVRDADFVDILVKGPGITEPIEFHAVRWRDDPATKLCGARPKRVG